VTSSASPDPRRELGQRGEQYATEHFIRLDYKVIARNCRLGRGELDLVVYDGRTLVFVEVKTRREGPVPPLESLGVRKRTQLRRLAVRWLSERHVEPRPRELRFDAVGVVLDAGGRLLRLDHIENAF
jgi:putative endonuclease